MVVVFWFGRMRGCAAGGNVISFNAFANFGCRRCHPRIAGCFCGNADGGLVAWKGGVTKERGVGNDDGRVSGAVVVMMSWN